MQVVIVPAFHHNTTETNIMQDQHGIIILVTSQSHRALPSVWHKLLRYHDSSCGSVLCCTHVLLDFKQITKINPVTDGKHVTECKHVNYMIGMLLIVDNRHVTASKQVRLSITNKLLPVNNYVW